MPELSVVELLVDSLAAHAPQVLGLAALLAALGLPLPVPLFVLAAGALVAEGMVDPFVAVAALLAGSQLGEGLYFLLGRHGGPAVRRRLGKRLASAWSSAEKRFAERPGLTVYLTRFLLTPLGIPTNLIAGSSGYGYFRFLRSAGAGDLMWILAYGLAGYVARDHWRELSHALGDYSAVVAALALATAVIIWLVRTLPGRLAAPAKSGSRIGR
jgi:membrane-associated protein